jgi:hypothetical protein
LMRGFQKYRRNWILTMAFWGSLSQGKNVLPDGLNWLRYFAGNSKKPLWEFNFFHIFGIPSSSRHEKHCQILQTLFWVFQNSRNSQWLVIREAHTALPVQALGKKCLFMYFLWGNIYHVFQKFLFIYLTRIYMVASGLEIPSSWGASC